MRNQGPREDVYPQGAAASPGNPITEVHTKTSKSFIVCMLLLQVVSVMIVEFLGVMLVRYPHSAESGGNLAGVFDLIVIAAVVIITLTWSPVLFLADFLVVKVIQRNLLLKRLLLIVVTLSFAWFVNRYGSIAWGL